jgi:DNA-directed RNA polymerase subunit beta'
MVANLNELNPIYMWPTPAPAAPWRSLPLAGMRGMANPKGEIIERPIKANSRRACRCSVLGPTHGAARVCRHGAAHRRLGLPARRLTDVSQDDHPRGELQTRVRQLPLSCLTA